MTYGTETDGKKQHIVTNKAETAVQQTSVWLKSKVDHKTDAVLMWLVKNMQKVVGGCHRLKQITPFVECAGSPALVQ